MNKYSKTESVLRLISPIKTINSLDEAILYASNESVLTLCSEDFFEKAKRTLEKIKSADITGNIVLVGIWRGGSSIFVKQMIDELKLDVKLFLVDTFEGFRESPSNKHHKDKSAYDFFVKKFPITKNPDINDVKNNFNRLNVSLENVFFVNSTEIEFIDTQIEKIAFLHIDVDMYEPTFFYLNKLYSKISNGGTVIVDDYNSKFFNCKEAVNDFLKQNGHHHLYIGEQIALWEK